MSISLFKMAPKCGAEVLPSVPKCKKAMPCLTEKICMLDKLLSSMSCHTVHESTVYMK